MCLQPVDWFPARFWKKLIQKVFIPSVSTVDVNTKCENKDLLFCPFLITPVRQHGRQYHSIACCPKIFYTSAWTFSIKGSRNTQLFPRLMFYPWFRVANKLANKLQNSTIDRRRFHWISSKHWNQGLTVVVKKRKWRKMKMKMKDCEVLFCNADVYWNQNTK